MAVGLVMAAYMYCGSSDETMMMTPDEMMREIAKADGQTFIFGTYITAQCTIHVLFLITSSHCIHARAV